MGRLSRVVPPPDEENLVSHEQIFKIRFGKRILLNGRVINPFAYDPRDPQSIIRAVEKMSEAFEYISNKREKLVLDMENYLITIKKTLK